LKIALVSAELVPFAKSGGLGDAVAGLARQLVRRGHDVRPFLPLYRSIDRTGLDLHEVEFARDVPIRSGPHELRFTLRAGKLPGDGPTVYFIDCPGLYDRKSIYTGDLDDAGRFAFLARASIESCQRMGFGPAVFHVNDWHAALVPLYLRTHYAWDQLFRRSKTLLSIHNVGYQGVFGADVVEDLDLADHRAWLPQIDLAGGKFNFLRAGAQLADALSTVSPRHAREIQTAEYGSGLEGLLRARAGVLFGILNGVDEDWNPATDALLPVRYDADSLDGKLENKRRLIAELGFARGADRPLFGIVSRLTRQKGFDIAFDLLPALLTAHDAQLAVVGSGEARYENYFTELAARLPGRVVFYRGYSNDLAHRVEAAADIFLMPSLYEPCGLNQLYSLRYGTIPVVRATGGLADSVRPYDWKTGEGTGFVFEHFTAEGLAWAIESALATYRDPIAWTRLVRQAMAQDFTWDRQVTQYLELYEWMTQR
jgi:starch synthase